MTHGLAARRVGVTLGATLLAAGALTAVTTAAAPQEASAAAVGRLTNSRYSDRPVKIYENKNGHGDRQWVHPGQAVKTVDGEWQNGHAESIKIPGVFCVTLIDPVIGPTKVIDRRGKKGMIYNFPVRMMTQNVTVRVYCYP